MQETNVTEKTKIKPLWFSILRIFLGLYLLWKGIVFIRDTALLEQLIQRTGVGAFSNNASTLSFMVAYLSLLCGLFIATGLWTKFFSVIQIPILIVAVFFVNLNRIDSGAIELVMSVITLGLLIFFAFKGSGSLSADEFFRSYYKAGSEDGQTKRFRSGS